MDRQIVAVPSRNSLVASLDGAIREHLLHNARRVTLAPGEVVMRQGEGGDLVFPETVALMLSVACGNGQHQDAAVIGCDGLVGWTRLLDRDDTPFEARVVVQAGHALLVPVAAMRMLADQQPAAMRPVFRFVQRLGTQIARNLASGLCDGAEQRLARLLLMLHERLDGDELPVTHLFLANALNLRRATVTDTLHILEGARLVRCTRGRIVIRDHPGLVARAGSAYGPSEALAA